MAPRFKCLFFNKYFYALDHFVILLVLWVLGIVTSLHLGRVYTLFINLSIGVVLIRIIRGNKIV